MYKAFTGLEYKKHMGLPKDYKIEGFLSYGAWDEEKQVANLKTALKKLGVKYKITIPKYGFLQHVREIKIGSKKYWFTVMYGGAMLSEYTHLACLFGSKKNIHIGSCGGLNPNLNSLDLIIPTYSYGNESTTRVYERNSKHNKHYSSKSINAELIKNVSPNIKVQEGAVISCQAMMGETWEDVRSWSKRGYSGVEMETAVFFSVSNHFKVPCGALVYISDNLIKKQTVHDESHKKEKNHRALIKIQVYLAGLKTLLQNDK